MTKYRVVIATIALPVFLLLSVIDVRAGGRQELPNEVNLELAGKCLIYSFSYQRMLVEAFGLEAGVSMLGGGSSGSSTTILFFTGGGKFYFIPKNASPYIGGGIVVVSAST